MHLPFNMNLQGKTCVITGAGGVLCSAFARAVASCGAKVALLDINLEAAQAVAQTIEQDGGLAKAYNTDVLDREQVMSVHKQVLNDFGCTDILINGAGGNNPRATTDHEFYFSGDIERSEISNFFNLSPDGISFVFGLNFLGTLIPSQVFMQDMLGRADCVVVNISSMNSFLPLTKIPAYSAAKAAISNFTKWMAVHFSKEGIRVNAIAPGFFVTKQNQKLLFQESGEPTARTSKILNGTPIGRFGKEEELLGTLLYLLNNEASGFVTGVVIPVDGGFSAYSGV